MRMTALDKWTLWLRNFCPLWFTFWVKDLFLKVRKIWILKFVYISNSCLFTISVGQVTPEDKVRREIIQLLCIEPMTHSGIFEISRQKFVYNFWQLFVYNFSELNKALTQDIVNHETGNFELISRNSHTVEKSRNHSVKINEIY